MFSLADYVKMQRSTSVVSRYFEDSLLRVERGDMMESISTLRELLGAAVCRENMDLALSAFWVMQQPFGTVRPTNGESHHRDLPTFDQFFNYDSLYLETCTDMSKLREFLELAHVVNQLTLHYCQAPDPGVWWASRWADWERNMTDEFLEDCEPLPWRSALSCRTIAHEVWALRGDFSRPVNSNGDRVSYQLLRRVQADFWRCEMISRIRVLKMVEEQREVDFGIPRSMRDMHTHTSPVQLYLDLMMMLPVHHIAQNSGLSEHAVWARVRHCEEISDLGLQGMVELINREPEEFSVGTIHDMFDRRNKMVDYFRQFDFAASTWADGWFHRVPLPLPRLSHWDSTPLPQNASHMTDEEIADMVAELTGN